MTESIIRQAREMAPYILKIRNYAFDEETLQTQDPEEFRKLLQQVRENLLQYHGEEKEVNFIGVVSSSGVRVDKGDKSEQRRQIQEDAKRKYGFDEVILATDNLISRIVLSAVARIGSRFRKANFAAIGGDTAKNTANILNGIHIPEKQGIELLQNMADPQKFAIIADLSRCKE